MAKTSLTVDLHIEGARETLAAFRRLPKEASAELRDRALKLSELLASTASRAARGDSPQAAAVASTIKARRDRVPSVQVGGAKRVGSRRTPAFKILFGAEFGASPSLPQFRPHRGREGYWFFPSVEAEQGRISREWNKAADEVVRKFTAGDV